MCVGRKDGLLLNLERNKSRPQTSSSRTQSDTGAMLSIEEDLQIAQL